MNTGQHLSAVPALLAVLIGGCAGTTDFAYPTAKVAAVRIDQQTDQGVRVLVVVNLNNPNNYPLPLDQSSYTVTLAGIGEFSDSAKTERTLPSRGTETIEMPAAFATHGVLATGQTFQVHGSITCVPPGNLRLLMSDLYIPLPSTDISASGVVQSAVPAPVPPPLPAPPATTP